ncbi:nucleotidyltransferase family protein [Dyella acidiphila]|uniref:Nucleotidyltransferase family protein n=1 Tax=Dyella acidiphila TaxID=2775866 RepID=A0ABR9G9T5_9GAMM|nr:nucleotidyltransferase family protein [Dyella acidiphila]MBE1160779.1 nucleotidyltransferase family protein [Dyella acidiphila]
MSTQPVILLLAAGEGSRFGGAKQLADIDGEPMVRRVARRLLLLDLPLVVVTGAHADQVEAVLDDLPLGLSRCDEWALGMGRSIAAGVHEVAYSFPQASAVLICLADQPLLSSACLQAILQHHRDLPTRIVATQHASIVAPPALFPRTCFDALMALSGPQGARSVIEQHAASVDLIAADSTLDVDTQDDLQQVRETLAKHGR